MRTKSFFSTLIVAFFCSFFSLTAQDTRPDTTGATLAEAIETGETIIQTGKEVSKMLEGFGISFGKKKKPKPESSEPKSSVGQKPTTNSKPQETVAKKTTPLSGGQNSPTTLSPNESKTTNINGASTSLSNRMADYTITVNGCKGSSSDQAVTIYFTVQHGLADQYLAVRASHSKAFAGGVSYNKFATKVGGKSNNNTVPYQVKLSCEATIKYVPPSVESFESVSIDLYSTNKGSNGAGKKTGKLELRNLKIAWQ